MPAVSVIFFENTIGYFLLQKESLYDTMGWIKISFAGSLFLFKRYTHNPACINYTLHSAEDINVMIWTSPVRHEK